MITCPELVPPVGISITYSEKVVGGRVGVGVTATYSCMGEGQGLSVGGIMRTCECSGESNVTKTGEWSDGATPMCECRGKIYCGHVHGVQYKITNM